MKFLILLFVFTYSAMAFSSDQYSEIDRCRCVGAQKDYSSAKGYYFGKVSGGLVSRVSARFSCEYTCRDAGGKLWKVSYIHEESHTGSKTSGPQFAKWFNCDQSVDKFIPHYNEVGQINYYNTTAYGPFNPAQSSRAELKAFAQQNSCN